MPITIKTGGKVQLNSSSRQSLEHELLSVEPESTVAVPLIGFDSTPMLPIARVGERVAKYSMLARSKSNLYWTASPVSGVLRSIQKADHPSLGPIKYAVLRREDSIAPLECIGHNPSSMNPQGVVLAAKQACIIDECDGLPLAYKLQQANRESVRLLVADGIDDAPNMSSSLKTIEQFGSKLGDGIGLALKALDGGTATLAYYDPGKLDNDALCSGFGFIDTIRLVGGYPAWPGFEKSFIEKRSFLRVGVQALAALSDAVRYGIPQCRTIITVCGDCVATPCNVIASMGSSVGHILEQVGVKKAPSFVLLGNTMSGACCTDLSTPIYPGIRVICAMSELPGAKPEKTCISCGRCSACCPLGLLPSHAVLAFENRRFSEAARFGAASCIGCGACSAVCPSGIEVCEIMQYLK